MDWDDVYPAFTLGLVAALVMAIKAVVDAGRLRARFALLTEKFAMLDHRMLRLTERLDAAIPPPAEAAPRVEPEAPAVTEVEPAPAAPEPVAAESATLPEAPATPELPPPPAPALPGRGWEQLLVEHWLVWVGSAAMALGGAFLVKLSIDQGLLTPLVRVILGVLLGVGLSVGAEWVRRRELAEDAAAGGASYVPQAFAAAGAATVFASLYAAHALYGFLPAGLAFPLLALTAGATVLQSLQHGPLVAALGLVGAYVVPLLVTSAAPAALPLFAYLAVVTAASLTLLRFREWWWLAWPSLAGAILWVVLWLATPHPVETPVVAGYLLVQFALFVAFRRGIPNAQFLAGVVDTAMVRMVTRAAFWAIAYGFLALANADGFGSPSVGAALLLAIGLLAFAYRDSALDDVIAVAGVLALTLLASWDLTLPIPEMSLWVFKIETDRIGDFSKAAILFTLLLGGGGFAMLTRVARPGRWAALSASVPLLVLVIAYWRLQQFQLDFAWTLAALALAGIELGAAVIVVRRRGEPPETAPEIEIALAAYAVGVLGSTILAATLALGNAWLTVALALHLPAIGWVEDRIRIPVLRRLALGVAAVVLVRLAFNPYILNYPIGPTPIFNWLLYGYGIPAAAFIVATKQFGSSRDDLLVAVLEAGSAVFSLLLLSLEVTHAIYGNLATMPLEDFGAGAALIALWLTFGGILLAVGDRRQRPVLRWGGWLLLAVTTYVALPWQPIMLLFGARVGNLPVFDALLLADAAPAVIYATIAWLIGARPVLRTIARVLAAAYAFSWITLEIQHLFHGKVELFWSSTEAEWYLYSVAWLAFAGAGFAGGLWWRNRWLRQAGLVGIGIVIAKVFLSDMAELSGVLRALSFLGLGLALVGFGYAYRRFRPVQPSL